MCYHVCYGYNDVIICFLAPAC
uniref:Uncharacterized protein n=1 Tax=Anguilla anguilla TaxID=7936 RepID=A0A0E9VCC2_ANGAN